MGADGKKGGGKAEESERKMTVNVSREALLKLKIEAARQRRSMSSLVEEWIDEKCGD